MALKGRLLEWEGAVWESFVFSKKIVFRRVLKSFRRIKKQK
jgi:hypothetical protein